MSLLKQIAEDQGSRAAVEMAAERQAAQARQQQYEALDDIITKKLHWIAADMGGVELVDLSTTRGMLPKYFVLDDVVIKVELFEYVDNPDPSRPHLVINEFCVSLVGVDGDYLATRQIGMLSLFSYESLYTTIVKEQLFCNFDAKEVLKHPDF